MHLSVTVDTTLNQPMAAQAVYCIQKYFYDTNTIQGLKDDFSDCFKPIYHEHLIMK
jgi:hypothetical protein